MRANDISEIVNSRIRRFFALRQVRLKQLDALGIRKYSNKRRKKLIYTYFEDDEHLAWPQVLYIVHSPRRF